MDFDRCIGVRLTALAARWQFGINIASVFLSKTELHDFSCGRSHDRSVDKSSEPLRTMIDLLGVCRVPLTILHDPSCSLFHIIRYLEIPFYLSMFTFAIRSKIDSNVFLFHITRFVLSSLHISRWHFCFTISYSILYDMQCTLPKNFNHFNSVTKT